MSIVTARKLIFLTFFLILAGIIYLFSTSSARAFTGSGTEEDPYHLQDCNDLLQINNHLSSHFIIDGSYGCAGENFPVARQMTGNSLANGFQGFSGVLDGNGNTITYTSTN